MAIKDNILSSAPTAEEKNYMDKTLRPVILKDFVGQDNIKENLKVFIEAAKARKEPLDHCMFYSPPGLGKTTLAHILAREMGANIKVTSGPALAKPGDLAAMLTTELEEGDIFFIDEIHRLNAVVEEALYPVMEDFLFFINTGKGPGASTLKLAVPKFTLAGATTRSGLLTGPLRDRFGIVFNLNFYSIEEIKKILFRSASILNIKAQDDGIAEIALRSRGTPRIANRLLKRVRDFAQVKGNGIITMEITMKTMKSLEIDEEGLDMLDRKLLLTIAEKFNGGPVGVETLAVAISEEIDTLTDVIEPFLIQAGLLSRTPRGRIVAPKAYQHLKIKPPY
ncbi:MAG: Holliday junction branch migration DNA helicase RuvB [Elusimicrobia bacterium]|nr:Holliday junction branch migration DNA helicase RuvB [Elusimicrobiota bacterium]